MAARNADGEIQVILYNGQNPGAGPSDDQYYDETEAHSIGLTVGGLDSDVEYTVTEYRVDSENGNAYAVWQEMGRPSMPDMSEDDWQALRDAMESSPADVDGAVCDGVMSKTFSLTSPGVLFLTLTPSE
jgi:beta-xylosidase